MDEFHAEVNRIVKQQNAEQKALSRELHKVNSRISSMLKAIEDGMYARSMKARMEDLERQKVELDDALREAPIPPDLHLHPSLSQVYADKVAHLEEALDDPEARAEAMEVIRSMIDRIELTPVEDGLRAELHGDLAEIVAACETVDGKKELPGNIIPGCQFSVVAGARNCLNLLLFISGVNVEAAAS